MFESLLNFLISVRDWIFPWTVVQHWERGVQMRLGVPIKDLDPGFHWILPFGFDDVLTETIVPNSCHTNTQTLTTLDGKRINVSMVVVYEIKNVRKFVTECEGRGAFVSDAIIAIVSKHVRNKNLADLCSDESCQEMYKAARARGFRYGVEVQSLEFADCAQGTGLRLFNSAE